MIYGIGIDMLEISRMEQILLQNQSFLKVFGAAELKQLKLRNKAESYAANFCAKEAFSKALGTGLRGFSLKEVEVLRDGAGKPYFQLSGRAKAIAQKAGLIFHVSLTHTDSNAAAFVVAEKAEEAAFPAADERECGTDADCNL